MVEWSHLKLVCIVSCIGNEAVVSLMQNWMALGDACVWDWIGVGFVYCHKPKLLPFCLWESAGLVRWLLALYWISFQRKWIISLICLKLYISNSCSAEDTRYFISCTRVPETYGRAQCLGFFFLFAFTVALNCTSWLIVFTDSCL